MRFLVSRLKSFTRATILVFKLAACCNRFEIMYRLTGIACRVLGSLEVTVGFGSVEEHIAGWAAHLSCWCEWLIVCLWSPLLVVFVPGMFPCI